jgi:two-component system, oxyanion-binding sensor
LPGASSKLEGGITEPTGVGSIQGRLILSADSFFDGQAFDPEDFEQTSK